MTRRNPPAKWVLPEIIDPENRRCVQIYVPDEKYHIAAFWGALLTLASAYKWADDLDHKAKDVALVWRGIIDNTEWGCCLTEPFLQFRMIDCALEYSITSGVDWLPMPDLATCFSFDVRQNSENPCTLEKKIGDGEWEQFADLQACPPKIKITDGKIQWYNPATDSWQELDNQGENTPQPPQPGTPDNVPTIDGECTTLAFVVNGAGYCIVPLPIEECWEVTTVLASGAWTYDDSNPFENWYCYDGHEFLLGACTSSDAGIDAAFPVPDALKYSLVLRYPDGASGVALVVGETVTIPAGTTPGSFILQMNDDDLTGNQGSVSVVLTFCKQSCPIDDPCSTGEKDLTVAQYGTRFATDSEITAWYGSGNNHYPHVGTWNSGVGYQDENWYPGYHNSLYFVAECADISTSGAAHALITVTSNGADLYFRAIDSDGVSVLYSHTTNVNATDAVLDFTLPAGTKFIALAQLSYANTTTITKFEVV